MAHSKPGYNTNYQKMFVVRKVLVDATEIFPESVHGSVPIYIMRYLNAIPREERENYTLLILSKARKIFEEKFSDFKLLEFKQLANYGDVRFVPLRWLIRKIDTKRMVRIISKGHYDVFLCPTHLPFYGKSKIKCSKKLLVVHDLKELKESCSSILGAAMLTFQTNMRAKHLESFDQIIACSKFTKQDILDYFPQIHPEKVHVVYNSVKLADTSVCPKKFNESHYILYVNTLRRYKNIGTLVRAFIALKDKISNNLVVVGKDYDYWTNEVYPMIVAAGIEHRVIRLKNISDEELRYLYEHADLFVSTSLHEGFGYTPIEAAICKCPVISTTQESLLDATQGLLDYYYPAMDDDALADKILDVLSNYPSQDELEQISEKYKEAYAPNVQERAINELLLG
jgi:glycosyltransferase involved in cell wall biosynthesis